MSAYYGAAVGGYSPHVICHKIQIEGYTRRLKNGKIVNVNGYVSSRDAADNSGETTYAVSSPSKQIARQRRDTATRANIANAKSRFSSGISRAGKSAQSLYRTTVGGKKYNSNVPDARERVIDYGREGLRTAAGAAVDIAGGYARLAADKISDVMSDGYNAFKSAISTAGSAIAKAFNAGKSFIEGIIGKIGKAASDIAGKVGKAVDRAGVDVAKVAGKVKDSLTPKEPRAVFRQTYANQSPERRVRRNNYTK